MFGLLSWLVGSSTGRAVALIGMAVAALGLGIAWAFYRGKETARLEAVTRSLETIRKRVATDEDLARLTPDQRRQRLRDAWSDG